MKITIAIPVYDEEDGIPILLEKLGKISTKIESEILFVNVGSNDNSLKILLGQYNSLKNSKIIDLKNNYGQNAAIIAGFYEASNDYVMTIDADLQNDPEDIINLINNYPQEFDMFCGIRSNRNDPAWRIILSKVFNLILSVLIGKNSNDIGCPMRITKRNLALKGAQYQNRFLFYSVPITLLAKRVGQMRIHHKSRKQTS